MSALILFALLSFQSEPEPPQEPEGPPLPVAESVQDTEELPKGEGRLVSLVELAQAPAEELVTVLYHCKQADAVTASRSVSSSFSNPRAVRMQSDARANAVFVSGSAVVVREAVQRLDALDAIKPKEVIRPVRSNHAAADGPMDVIDSYQDGAVEAQTSIGFLIAGLIGLSVVGVLLARRLVR